MLCFEGSRKEAQQIFSPRKLNEVRFRERKKSDFGVERTTVTGALFRSETFRTAIQLLLRKQASKC